MNKLPKKPRSQKSSKRLKPTEEDLLKELSFGDLLYSFLTSGRSTKSFLRTAQERAMYRYRRRKALDKLIEAGYINVMGDVLSISESGRNAIHTLADIARESLSKKVWDSKWRIVSYDIPEALRDIRNEIRSMLVRAGFRQLHQSVWIFPHDCAELIQLLKREAHLQRHVLYGTLESIESEQQLKKLFNLP